MRSCAVCAGRIAGCGKSGPGKSNGLVRSGDGTEGVFRFMRAHRAEFRVTTMARVLGVSTSGFYAWLKRPRSGREKSDTALAERVRAIHERSRGTYGAPRIQACRLTKSMCWSPHSA